MNAIFKPIIDKASELPEQVQEDIARDLNRRVQQAWLDEELKKGAWSLENEPKYTIEAVFDELDAHLKTQHGV